MTASGFRALPSEAPRLRVLVAGTLNMDTLLETSNLPTEDSATIVDRVERCPGGHAGNCSAALAALGLTVRILAMVGEDEDGDRLIADLEASGVDTASIRRSSTAPTGQVYIPTSRGRHFMLLWRGANDRLDVDVSREIADFAPDAVVLFDPPHPILEQFAALPRKDRSPSLYWCPGPINARNPNGIADRLIPAVDVLIVNRGERSDLGDAAEGTRGGELVTTLGPAGAEAILRGARETIAAHEIDVVDTVGSGDAFIGAYLLGREARLPLRERLALANGYGALAATGVGARGGLAPLSRLIRFLAEAPVRP